MQKSQNIKYFFVLLVLCILVLNSPLVLAQEKKIDEILDKVLPEIIEMRHHIHQYPELGNREFKTAKLVAEHLRKNGLEVITEVAHTGVVGILKGGKPGPVVAVRADMDALPVTERTDLPYKSTVKAIYRGREVGVMHACGHDIHTAIQLGVVSVLASIKKDIPGTVKFIFQPAEEGSPPGERGGASLMVEEGVLENPRPEAIFGLHTSGDKVGRISYAIGPSSAAVDHFEIIVKGKQAHGASPDQSIDAIVTAAQVVLALQTIRSRNLSPLEPSVISVCVFRAGERFNIIPEQVYLEGTVRTHNPTVRDAVERRMEEILDGITKSAGATFELNYGRGSSAVINDSELAKIAVPVLKGIVGEKNVVQRQPGMTGEDFSSFANVIPGFFYNIGSNDFRIPSGPHHAPNFRAEDSCLPIGIKAMSQVLLEYLRSRRK